MSSPSLTLTVSSLLALFTFGWNICNGKPIFIEVGPGAKECFYEAYQPGEMMEFLYVVKKGGQHDIELMVYDPFNELIAQKIGSKYDRFRQQLSESVDGTYKICFNNAMSRWTAKTVGIDLLGSHRPQQPHYNQLTKQRHLNKMNNGVIKLSDRIDEIEQLQQISIDLDSTFFDMVKTNASNLSYFTLIQLFVVLAINVFQIRQIRAWFKKHRKGYGI